LQPGDCGTIDDNPASPDYIFAVIGSPDANNAFHPFSTEISTSKWMGKLGLDYAVSDDILAYATLSNAFKSGGFNGNNSQTTSQLEPYKPEELTSLEIGLKTTLLDGDMQFNTSAFYYDYTDKQEAEFVYTFVGAIAGLGNVPESEVTGVEMELQWVPFSGLHLNLGVAYLDTEIKKWITPLPTGRLDPATGEVIGGELTDGAGASLPQSPRWSYNAMARYEWSIGNDLMMEVGGDLNYTDEMGDPVRPQGSLEDRTLVNARVGVSDAGGKWRALLWSRNLTDEYYYTAAFGGINGGYARMVGMPRTYGVSLEYNF
jgi:iron complex outermembrane receptor protein